MKRSIRRGVYEDNIYNKYGWFKLLNKNNLVLIAGLILLLILSLIGTKPIIHNNSIFPSIEMREYIFSHQDKIHSILMTLLAIYGSIIAALFFFVAGTLLSQANYEKGRSLLQIGSLRVILLIELVLSMGLLFPELNVIYILYIAVFGLVIVLKAFLVITALISGSFLSLISSQNTITRITDDIKYYSRFLSISKQTNLDASSYFDERIKKSNLMILEKVGYASYKNYYYCNIKKINGRIIKINYKRMFNLLEKQLKKMTKGGDVKNKIELIAVQQLFIGTAVNLQISFQVREELGLLPERFIKNISNCIKVRNIIKPRNMIRFNNGRITVPQKMFSEIELIKMKAQKAIDMKSYAELNEYIEVFSGVFERIILEIDNSTISNSETYMVESTLYNIKRAFSTLLEYGSDKKDIISIREILNSVSSLLANTYFYKNISLFNSLLQLYVTAYRNVLIVELESHFIIELYKRMFRDRVLYINQLEILPSLKNSFVEEYIKVLLEFIYYSIREGNIKDSSRIMNEYYELIHHSKIYKNLTDDKNFPYKSHNVSFGFISSIIYWELKDKVQLDLEELSEYKKLSNKNMARLPSSIVDIFDTFRVFYLRNHKMDVFNWESNDRLRLNNDKMFTSSLRNYQEATLVVCLLKWTKANNLSTIKGNYIPEDLLILFDEPNKIEAAINLIQLNFFEFLTVEYSIADFDNLRNTIEVLVENSKKKYLEEKINKPIDDNRVISYTKSLRELYNYSSTVFEELIKLSVLQRTHTSKKEKLLKFTYTLSEEREVFQGEGFWIKDTKAPYYMGDAITQLRNDLLMHQIIEHASLLSLEELDKSLDCLGKSSFAIFINVHPLHSSFPNDYNVNDSSFAQLKKTDKTKWVELVRKGFDKQVIFIELNGESINATTSQELYIDSFELKDQSIETQNKIFEDSYSDVRTLNTEEKINWIDNRVIFVIEGVLKLDFKEIKIFSIKLDI